MSFQNQPPKSQLCAVTSKAIINGTIVKINNKEIEEIILKDPEGAGGYEKGKILANKTCFYQLALEKNVIEGKRTELTFYNDKIVEGLEYLNLSLEKGFPVMVGVNHTFNKTINESEKAPQTTDHFVVIVGRTCENGQIYYPFWEVGTSKGKEGYKFKLESNNHLTCDKPYRKVPEPYVVTQIRRNIGLFKKKDGKEEIKKIRIENLKEEL